MDAVTAVETALVAGATAGASRVATRAITDAYDNLKSILVTGYRFASVALLDADPREPDFRKALRTELEKRPEISDDVAVLNLVSAVHTALKQESPETLAAWGVRIGDIEAAGSVVIERISGTGGGFRANTVKGSSVRISDIQGGYQPGKY